MKKYSEAAISLLALFSRNTHQLRRPLLRALYLSVAIGALLLMSLRSGTPVAYGNTFEIPNDNVYDMGGLVEALYNATSLGGAHTINLAANGTYKLNQVIASFNGRNGLPPIGLTEITINGKGATIFRDTAEAIPEFRIFYVTEGATLTINGLTVTGGSAVRRDLLDTGIADDGGGILNRGKLTLTNSTITANTAGLNRDGTVIEAQEGDGGGIVNSGGVLTLVNSTVSNNKAGDDSGGIHNQSQGLVTLTNSTVSQNVAIGSGGGIENEIGTLTITNSTLSNNKAKKGGGIDNSFTLTVTSSTLSGNEASGDGGGIFNEYNSTTRIKNTIVANNLKGGNCFGPIINEGNNLQYGGVVNSCGATMPTAPTDPLLGKTLANNGGPTQTIALPSGSLAIDAGPDVCTDADNQPLAKDQRGASRPFPTGGKCDIGAYEYGILDVAEKTFGPGGGTVTTGNEGGGATPGKPLKVTVTTPNAGSVSIQTKAENNQNLSGFRFVGGHQVIISVPPGATRANPITIEFRIDAPSLGSGVNASKIDISKDGNIVELCLGSLVVPENRTSCVTSRVDPDPNAPDNDVVITVLTISASEWSLIVPVVKVDGQIQVLSVERPLAGTTQPGGIFPMKATLKNIGPDLSNLFFRVATLSYVNDFVGPHPELANRSPGSPAGVGAELDAELPGGTWENGETFSITFNVLVPKVAKFVAIVHAFTLAPAP